MLARAVWSPNSARLALVPQVPTIIQPHYAKEVSKPVPRKANLPREHPGDVAAAFLGHSTAVANKHYWQVTDEDFERAIQGSSKAVQNPAQYLHVSARTDSQGTCAADEKTLVLPVHAPQCTNVPGGLVGDEGLEPPTSTV